MKSEHIDLNSEYLRGFSKVTKFFIKCVYMSAEDESLDDERLARCRRIVSNLDDCWHEAQSTQEFIELVKNNVVLQGTSVWSEIVKEDEELTWDAIYENISDRSFVTYSDTDTGSVLVGNRDFGSYVLADSQDDIIRCAIFEDSEEFYCYDLMRFNTAIEGKFYIYDNNNCNGNKEHIVRELDGYYEVYSYNGLVVFVKYEYDF